MSYLSQDEQILIKIQKYMGMLKRLYSNIEYLTNNELDESTDGLALTQCVTNLFELSSRITDDAVGNKLILLSSGRTARIRNIAAQDYDAINWDIAKKNCKAIISAITDGCINECFEILADKKAGTKDYTQILNNPYEPPKQ